MKKNRILSKTSGTDKSKNDQSVTLESNEIEIEEEVHVESNLSPEVVLMTNIMEYFYFSGPRKKYGK